MSERVETWRGLVADIRQRAKCPLSHGEERITSGEAIGNLLMSIADRVQTVCERMDSSQHHADATAYCMLASQDAVIVKLRAALESIKKQAGWASKRIGVGSQINGDFMSIYAEARDALGGNVLQDGGAK